MSVRCFRGDDHSTRAPTARNPGQDRHHRSDEPSDGDHISRPRVTAVTTAANDLVARRFLLRADADAAIAAAVANPVLP